jgi:hypothetical protein
MGSKALAAGSLKGQHVWPYEGTLDFWPKLEAIDLNWQIGECAFVWGSLHLLPVNERGHFGGML